MKKTIQALSVIIALIMTLGCFTFSGYATNDTDVFISSAPETTLKIVKKNNSAIVVESNGEYSPYRLNQELTPGFKISYCPTGTHTRVGFDENGTLFTSIDFTGCESQSQARISPAKNASMTKTHSFYDNDGDIYFNVVAKVSGTWSKSKDAASVIDNVYLEISGYADGLCDYQFSWQDDNSFILNFYLVDSLIGYAKFILASNGRFSWSFEYV